MEGHRRKKCLKVERSDIFALFVLFAMVFIVFYQVVAKMAAVEHDYITHINRAISLLDNFVFSPHLLYQISTIALYLSLPLTIMGAGIFSVLLFYAALAVILYSFLKNDGEFSPVIALAGTICLFFVQQIPAFYPVDHHLYFGYIGVNALHNPTIVVLKPLALLLLILSARIVVISDTPLKTLFVVGCALLSILTAFAKPNYTICFIPALILVLVFRACRRLPVNWGLALYGFLLPAISFLLLQYAVSYADFIPWLPRFYEQSSVVFAPLKVVKIYSSWLFPKFVLSVLFPLAVTLCYPREVLHDYLAKFSWLAFGMGAFSMYFLAESGSSRMAQGNFWWSGQITLFLLFACSLRIFLRMIVTNNGMMFLSRWKDWLLGGLLSLHFASGLLYYYAEYSQPQRFW